MPHAKTEVTERFLMAWCGVASPVARWRCPRPGVAPRSSIGSDGGRHMSRAQDAPEDAALQRRRSARQVRHTARNHLQTMVRDGDNLDEAILPTGRHDIGRKSSPKPAKAPQPGRRRGFKVWKTPFWK